MKVAILVLLGLAVSHAAVLQMQVKEGTRMEISQNDSNIKTWERDRDGKKETVTRCTGQSNVNCGKWIDQNQRVLTGSKVEILDNGSLIIDPFTKADVGSYTTPDQKKHPNLAQNVIDVSIV